MDPFNDESSDDIFSFSLNELDNLEALVIFAFILVTVRFFRRSKAEGVALWLSFKSYVFVSAVSVVFSLFIYLLVIINESIDRGVIAPSIFDENADLLFFASSIFYILALYAFTPLPKLTWFSKKKASIDEPEAPQQADFFTDSTGNTRADSINEDSK